MAWGGVHLPNGTLMAMAERRRETTVSEAVSARLAAVLRRGRRGRRGRRPLQETLGDAAPPPLPPPRLTQMSPYDVLQWSNGNSVLVKLQHYVQGDPFRLKISCRPVVPFPCDVSCYCF